MSTAIVYHRSAAKGRHHIEVAVRYCFQRRSKMKKAISLFTFLLVLASAFGQGKPAAAKYAMIFAVTGITLEDYQGGAGAAVFFDPLKIRAAVDARYKDSNVNPDELDIGFTGVFEYHLLKGKVSPYAGAFAGYRFEQDRNTVDADDWTSQVDHIIGAGPLIGVEFFVLDNLSFFAEYELAFLFTFPSTTVSTAGAVTTTPEDMELLLDARLGNGAKLGITVYF
jgi:hypothetical protein